MPSILPYNDTAHRTQVIDLWTHVFGYNEKRNDPARTIDKKLAVNDGLFFIAQDKDVIGTIMAGYDGHRGWIYSMAVIPERRGENIGTKLLQHTETELKLRGCIKINLQVFERNVDVKEFYLKNGYDIEERVSMGKEITSNIED